MCDPQDERPSGVWGPGRAGIPRNQGKTRDQAENMGLGSARLNDLGPAKARDMGI